MSDKKLPFGTNYCKCSACGRYFGGERAFSKHRVGSGRDRACLDPSGITDGENRPLFNLNVKGYWVRKYKGPSGGCT